MNKNRRPSIFINILAVLGIVLSNTWVSVSAKAVGTPNTKVVYTDSLHTITPINGSIHIEGQVESKSGWFSIIWGDNLQGASQLAYILTTDDGDVINLILDEEQVRSWGGVLAVNRTHVEIEGVWSTSQPGESSTTSLRVNSFRLIPLPVAPETKATVSGSKPWITIMCKFKDINDEPHNQAFFQGMYANTKPGLDHFWREQSYNTVNVAGSNASGWFVLPEVESHYEHTNPAGLNHLATDCIAAADASVNFSLYKDGGINMMFNFDWYSGWAWGGSWTGTMDGITQVWRTTWEPPWAYADISVIQHEMGHGFGLPHSSYNEAVVYDNAWDVMSKDRYNCSAATDATYGCIGQSTISYHKDKLGWIQAGQKFSPAEGTYTTITLEQLDLPTNSNYKMAQIPIGGSSTHFYTIEARRLVGYDVKLPGAAIIIHEVDTSRSIPAHIVDGDGNGDTSDGGSKWNPGETFKDGPNKIMIRVDSATSSGFQVTIGYRPIDFVIDDTGSMYDDIDNAKVVVNQKVDEFGSKGIYPKYHLLTYKDNVTYRGSTTDPDTIKSWVNGLGAGGGDDCPEEMLGALDRIAQEAPHSEAWLMTDAGFHGGPGNLATTVYNLVTAGVTVHPIIYGLCFDPLWSRTTASGQEGGSCAPEASSYALGSNTVAQIATETGGHFFFIDSSETQAVTSILLNEMITPADLATNTDSVTSGSPKTYDIQIDRTVEEANFLLNGITGSTDLVIYRPGGTQVFSTDPDVTFTRITNAVYYQVDAPTPGVWQVQIVGDGQFAFSTSGNTPISFDYLTDTSLPIGIATHVQVSLFGPITSTIFTLTNLDGTSPETIALFDDGSHWDGGTEDGIYGGTWTPTRSGEFRVHVQGITDSGATFGQVVSKIIRIQGLYVQAPADSIMPSGGSTVHDFTITNASSAQDTFNLTYSSSQGWADFSGLPASITIGAGATVHISIPINVPMGVAAGTTEKITLVAMSQANAMINDAASVEITISDSQRLDVNKAGNGSGVVTSSPDGIDCGETCSAYFGSNSFVTLYAAPAGDSNFSGWGGACSGTGSCMVTMDDDKSVIATFTLKTPSPPSNFQVINTTATSITLGWNDVGNETGYKIYKWLFLNNTWEFYYFTTLSANSIRFTESKLANNSGIHYYQVSAINSYGESARADWIGGGRFSNGTCTVVDSSDHSSTAKPNTSDSPASTPSLVAPKNNKLTTNRTPTFSWSKVPGARSYILQLSKSSTFKTSLLKVMVSSSTYTILKNLPKGTLYWRVQARGPNGPSSWSTIGSFIEK